MEFVYFLYALSAVGIVGIIWTLIGMRQDERKGWHGPTPNR